MERISVPLIFGACFDQKSWLPASWISESAFRTTWIKRHFWWLPIHHFFRFLKVLNRWKMGTTLSQFEAKKLFFSASGGQRRWLKATIGFYWMDKWSDTPWPWWIRSYWLVYDVSRSPALRLKIVFDVGSELWVNSRISILTATAAPFSVSSMPKSH